MRYFMSVNHKTKTHMDKLDNMGRQYLKLWLRIPKHGVTDASIFHPYMLNIKTPSQLYKEAQASTYAMIRIKGDNIVNHALDSRIERESHWTKKYSTVCEADKTYRENVANKTIVLPTTETDSEKKVALQGEFIKLLIEEETNVTWQSTCRNIPKGVLAFAWQRFSL